MSYGKYGMKMNVPTNGQQLPWSTNDPWYNIGGLIGSIWANNYNQRGIDKGTKTAQDMLNNGGVMPEPMGVSDEMYSQALKAGAIGNGKLTDASSENSQPKYENANKKLGLPDNGNAGNSISPQDVIANEKWQFIKNKYGGDTPNPTGDAITAGKIANTVNNNLANMDVSKLPIGDGKQMVAAIEAQLRKDGRTEYQIQQIMNSINPQIQAKVEEHNKGMYGDLFEQYKDALKARDYTTAQMLGSQMAKYDPDAAKLAMAGLPTMRDQYNVDETNKRIDKQHANKVFDMKFASELSKDQARYNHDLSFNDFIRQYDYKIRMTAKANHISYDEAAKGLFGIQQSKTNDQRMTAAKEALARYADFDKNNPGVPNPYAQIAKISQNYLTSVLTGGQQLSRLPANVNDYNQMQGWLDQMKEASAGKYTDAQLAAKAKKYLGDNSGYLDKALKDRGWIK